MIREHLPSFWWFIDGRAGGMGRPGFNRCRWFDLTLEEGVLFNWLAKQATPAFAAADLFAYFEAFGPKVAPFYGLTADQVLDRFRALRGDTLLDTFERMNRRTEAFGEIVLEGDEIRFTANAHRLAYEVELLRQHGIRVLISLIEEPLDHDRLSEHFEVHRFPIEDINPPTLGQVVEFARVHERALRDGKGVVTHCLAGIGRTTTMLAATLLLAGRSWAEVVAEISARNPSFQFRGAQSEFLRKLAEELSDGSRMC